ncbi:universal stress protein [Cytophaga aurantiaca]|uniref:universal stress protein n=1 Tax=Cytophaga aurantiaca TaxID=29530 RepID=UPI000378BE1F|nr:universal stress protein [Cytophaga aurantiaca]
MKTILVPTDFKSHSEKALKVAMKIAAKASAKIILVHSFVLYVTDIYATSDMAVDIYEEEKEQSKEILRNYCEKIRLEKDVLGNPLQAEYIVHQNFAPSEILLTALNTKADLIVMGAEKHSNLSIILGSIVNEVMHKSDCPVLLIHDETVESDFSTIYLGIEDLQKELPSVQQVIPFAKVFDATISIIHIDSQILTMPDLRNMNIERAQAETLLNTLKQEYDFSDMYLRYSVADEIIQTMDAILLEESPQILALRYQKRKWTDSIFHKSLIRYLMIHSSTPLLIIH